MGASRKTFNKSSPGGKRTSLLSGELDPESPPGTGVTLARIATLIDDLLGQGNAYR